MALQVPELLCRVSPGKNEGQHLLGAEGLLGVPKKGQAEGEALDSLLPLQPAASAFFGVGLRLKPVSDLLNALQAARQLQRACSSMHGPALGLILPGMPV